MLRDYMEEMQDPAQRAVRRLQGRTKFTGWTAADGAHKSRWNFAIKRYRVGDEIAGFVRRCAAVAHTGRIGRSLSIIITPLVMQLSNRVHIRPTSTSVILRAP